jgi:hypothetical protein
MSCGFGLVLLSVLLFTKTDIVKGHWSTPLCWPRGSIMEAWYNYQQEWQGTRGCHAVCLVTNYYRVIVSLVMISVAVLCSLPFHSLLPGCSRQLCQMRGSTSSVMKLWLSTLATFHTANYRRACSLGSRAARVPRLIDLPARRGMTPRACGAS